MLDASFIAKILLEEEGSEKARRLLRDWILRDEGLVTVDLAFSEVLNALWKHAAVLGDLEPGEALEAAKDLTRVWRLLDVSMAAGLAVEALRLALEEGITAYDALYLALALKRRTSLATFDTRLAETARKRGVPVYGLEE
ncbi:type II toxin-antitoxin system VapC family toxin [Pyrodictium abyssi]|uniref:type II toxin-antitoxin system VapC family toxin n=1 Tax=Pyrodictium abyssi TaxID=54256 RepID=UPI0030C72315